MCCSFKGFLIGSFVALVLSIAIGYYQIYKNESLTQSIIEWAETNKISIKNDKIHLKTFKIEFDQNEWNLLLKKLELTRYFKPLNNAYAARNEYGFDPEYAQELVEYWKTKFNWKSQIDYLNKYPQFKIQINDTTIHFLRVITNKKEDSVPIPIMLIDGWPGSFFGFYKMIEYIEREFREISFDIVVPSIPGYGYSTPLDRPLDVTDTAQLFDAIMRYLHGENCKYFVHGEDWGSIISSYLAQFYPSRVNGIHITMPVADETDLLSIFYSISSYIFPNLLYSAEEISLNVPQRYSLVSRISVVLREMGYFHLQATTPDTVAQGPTDSPVGLLAYILEKYYAWSFDLDSQVLGKKGANLDTFKKDDLLTIITLYWMTNTISSSIRFYKSYFNIFNKDWPLSKSIRSRLSKEVNVAAQLMANDLFLLPQKIVKLRYPTLDQFNIVKNGSHFAAFQNPALTADDFVRFINKVLKKDRKEK